MIKRQSGSEDTSFSGRNVKMWKTEWRGSPLLNCNLSSYQWDPSNSQLAVSSCGWLLCIYKNYEGSPNNLCLDQNCWNLIIDHQNLSHIAKDDESQKHHGEPLTLFNTIQVQRHIYVGELCWESIHWTRCMNSPLTSKSIDLLQCKTHIFDTNRCYPRYTPRRQTGQVFFLKSHSIRHSSWKACLHLSILASDNSYNSVKQTRHL